MAEGLGANEALGPRASRGPLLQDRDSILTSLEEEKKIT